MAMSASPDSGKSPGFCHIRRQSNRSAQKQIICPIYRGKPFNAPLLEGARNKNFGFKCLRFTPLKSEDTLILLGAWEPPFPEAITIGYFDVLESIASSRCGIGRSLIQLRFCRHSAAAANDSLGFISAADSMKSEMRGTISDLNREPLKTP